MFEKILKLEKKADSVLKIARMKFWAGNSMGHAILAASSGCWSQCGLARRESLHQQARKSIERGLSSLLGL